MHIFQQPLGASVLGGLLASVTSHSTLPSTATPTVAASAPSPTLTGIAASAPTIGPSHDVGKLPPLGWDSWYPLTTNCNEANVLDAANHIVSLGLANAGYQYIIMDDWTWPLQARSAFTDQLVPNPSKFPNGIACLADQVHGLGLKFGIRGYAGISGIRGCDGCATGSLGHEELDAATFAEWGVDYLRYYDINNIPANWTDSPNPPGGDWYNSNTAIRYRQMGAALNDTGRPFLFEIQAYAPSHVWEWVGRVAHSWFLSDNADASWSYITSVITSSIQYLDLIDFYSHILMDILKIGRGDLTIQEQRTHFAAWAFLKSELLLSTDLSKLTADQLAIVKNAELLAFNQDPIVGTPAKPFTPYNGAPTTSPPEYYAGKSSKGTHVFIINTDSAATTKTFGFAKVPGLGSGSRFVVHDMWTGKDLGTFSTSYSTTVDPHDTVAFLITPAGCHNC